MHDIIAHTILCMHDMQPAGVGSPLELRHKGFGNLAAHLLLQGEQTSRTSCSAPHCSAARSQMDDLPDTANEDVSQACHERFLRLSHVADLMQQ